LTLKSHDDIFENQITLKNKLEIESTRTVADLYSGIIIFSHFKPLEWPTHLQWVIEKYLNSSLKSINFFEANSNSINRRDFIKVDGFEGDSSKLLS